MQLLGLLILSISISGLPPHWRFAHLVVKLKTKDMVLQIEKPIKYWTIEECRLQSALLKIANRLYEFHLC